MTTIPAPATSTGPGSSEFDGVRALVTGGASGIGRATVRASRTRGAAVASLDLRPLAEPEEDILEIPCDVGNDASVRDAVAKVAKQMGSLDAVCPTQVLALPAEWRTSPDEEWHRVLDINLVGTARLVRAALPHLRLSAPHRTRSRGLHRFRRRLDRFGPTSGV